MAVILGDKPAPKVEINLDVTVGDYVDIVDGPFENFAGQIEEINQESQKLKVVLEMFGRETVTEVDFKQVKPSNS